MTEQIVAAPYEAFKGSLKGQTVTIPSIYTLIPEWQPDLHEEYERARDEALDPWIREVMSISHSRKLCEVVLN